MIIVLTYPVDHSSVSTLYSLASDCVSYPLTDPGHTLPCILHQPSCRFSVREGEAKEVEQDGIKLQEAEDETHNVRGANSAEVETKGDTREQGSRGKEVATGHQKLLGQETGKAIRLRAIRCGRGKLSSYEKGEEQGQHGEREV